MNRSLLTVLFLAPLFLASSITLPMQERSIARKKSIAFEKMRSYDDQMALETVKGAGWTGGALSSFGVACVTKIVKYGMQESDPCCTNKIILLSSMATIGCAGKSLWHLGRAGYYAYKAGRKENRQIKKLKKD